MTNQDPERSGASHRTPPGLPAAPLDNSLAWRPLAAAATLLVVELLVLTPLVEFHDEPLRTLASPALGHAALVALTVVVLTARRPAGVAPRRHASRRGSRLMWGIGHAAACTTFFALSLALSRGSAKGLPAHVSGAIWLVLAAGVAASALATFVSFGDLAAIAWHHRRTMARAIVVACAVALATPAARSAWHHVHAPASWLIGRLLAVYPGGEPVEAVVGGQPVIGTLQLTLLVTPFCAEMESFVAFWLILAATAGAGQVAWRPACLWLVPGTILLYLLNALRLYLLVVIGLWTSGGVSVALAHSRLGNLVMLSAAAAMIAVARRVGPGGGRRRASEPSSSSPPVPSGGFTDGSAGEP